jgi:hypothetical protein
LPLSGQLPRVPSLQVHATGSTRADDQHGDDQKDHGELDALVGRQVRNERLSLLGARHVPMHAHLFLEP